jgi:hypothetical protein
MACCSQGTKISCLKRQRGSGAGDPLRALFMLNQLRVTIGQCINDLEIIAKAGEPEDFHNRVEHLPLR